MAVVARMVASLEAETSQFHARMTAAEAQMTKWTSSTATGTRAARVLNNSIQQLAFQAGGIPGPIGKAATAIGVLGLGTGPVMLAVAALGALALIWKHVGEEAQRSADNQTAALDRLHGNIRKAISTAAPGAVAGALAEAQARLDSLRRAPLGPQRFMEVQGPEGVRSVNVGSPAGDRAEQIAILDTVVRQLSVGANAVTAAFEKVAEAAERTARDAAIGAIKDRGAFFLPTPWIRKGAEVEKGYEKVLQDALDFEREARLEAIANVKDAGMFFLPVLGKQDVMGGKTYIEAARRGGFRFTPEFAALSALAVAQGAQGGFGAFLGAASAPAAMINPLAGVITGTLATLFNVFDSKESERELAEERRHKELIGVLHEGPARSTNIFEGDPASSLYERDRQVRLGGEPRVGGL